MSIKTVSVVSKKEKLEFVRTILDVIYIKQENQPDLGQILGVRRNGYFVY